MEIARPDLEILAAIFDAEGDRQRRGEPDLELARDVEIGDELAVAQAAGVERALAGGAERGVEAVAHRIVEAVVPVADRQIGVPAGQLAAHADRAGVIFEIGIDEGQEAVGRQRHEIGGVGRLGGGERAVVAVGRGVLIAVIGRAETVAVPVGAEAVKFPVSAERHAGIDEEAVIFGPGVAIAEFEAVEGQLARIERRRRPVVVRPEVVAGAIGRVAVAIFGGEVHEPGADGHAEIGPERVDLAVVGVAFAIGGGGEDAVVRRIEEGLAGVGLQAGDVGDVVEGGLISAVGRGRAAAVVGAPELDVDHAGDRVRAILRRGAVAKHLDAADREARDQVEIHGGAAAADRAVDVEQRRDVAALAVDQHQGLVRAEAAQGGGAQRVGAVGDRGLRKVERGDEVVEDLVGLGLSRIGDRVGADHIDRNRAVGHRPVQPARAGDDDRGIGRGRLIGRGLIGGSWRGGRRILGEGG